MIRTFFPDLLSHNEKINYIFKQLIAVLNPIITGENSISCPTMNSHGKLVDKRYKYKLLSISPKNIKLVNEIEIPFKDIHIKLSGEDQITIEGTTFNYSFKADSIYIVYDRMKKVRW